MPGGIRVTRIDVNDLTGITFHEILENFSPIMIQ